VSVFDVVSEIIQRQIMAYSVTHSRSLKLAQVDHDFLSVFHCNNSSLLYHFPDKAKYWSKIAIFHTPPAFARRPPLRVSIRISSQRLVQKN